MSSPKFDSRYPRVDDYLREYEKAADKMLEFVENLMEFMSSGAGTIGENESKEDSSQ